MNQNDNAMAQVYIIGAGPGAPDLITLRALRAVEKSDLIICDALLPRGFFTELGLSPAGKEIHWRGEESELDGQERINEFMLRHARSGRTVARLKTGDPHIFGRGMEELEFLTQHGIRCEVIPGLTAATAFSSLTDLPITRRDGQNSFAVVTARCAGGGVNENLPRADSLVVFMGVSVLDRIVETLKQNGWAPDTPAAVLERMSMPWPRQAGGTLDEIAEICRRQGIGPPAILVVGKAADESHTTPARPQILFTGLDPANFRALGRILHWPGIRAVRNETDCRRLPGAVRRMQDGFFPYVIFTSRTSVRMFFAELSALEHDGRLLSRSMVIACGAGTAGRLKEHGIKADVTPRGGMGSESILAAVGGGDAGNVMLVQSATATEALAGRLAAGLGPVTRLCLHKVVPHPELGRPLPSHDVIYFTCPSGVRAYWDSYGRGAFEKEIWCIGDVTGQQLNEYGANARVVNPYVS